MSTKILLPTLFSLILNAAGFIFAQETELIRPDLSNPGNISQWDLDGSGSWKIFDKKLILYKAGVPSGPIRRPAAIAVLKNHIFQKVSIEAAIKSTAPVEVIRRDLDIIVGYESPARFYYIHLAGITDVNHNGIFIVDNADRKRIDSGEGIPQLKDTTWHNVKVVFDGVKGFIKVYVDQSEEPVLEASDKTISRGKIGLGSFDDPGEFQNILVTGFRN